MENIDLFGSIKLIEFISLIAIVVVAEALNYSNPLHSRVNFKRKSSSTISLNVIEY